MICFICDAELTQEMLITPNDCVILGFYAIIVKNIQSAVCPKCFKEWNKVLELLISRFKEQKYIDETICKKILEYKEE